MDASVLPPSLLLRLMFIIWQMDADTSANDVETDPFVLCSVTLTDHSCPLDAPDSLVSAYLLHFVLADFGDLTFDHVG